MIFILLSCSEPTATFSGSASSAGDSASSRNDANNQTHRWRFSNALCKESRVRKHGRCCLPLTRTLDISHVNISDLTILSGMTNLKSLSAYDNDITDVSPLASLDRMEELYLVSNKIKDISPLLALRQLSVLRLDGNQVESIEILPKLKRLNRLGLDGNKIRDFTPIQQA